MSNRFEEETLRFMARHALAAPGAHLCAAVSGGADSVAMLRALLALRERLGLTGLAVIHLNHGLRGAASDGDEAFVSALCKTLGVPFLSRRVDVRLRMERRGESLEAAARALRHAFFKEARHTFGADFVALAHTAGDQAEEVMLRLIRGAGPAGLSGMAPGTPGGLVRPILWARRGEVVSYLSALGQAWREDETNAQAVSRRNVLRNEVFPLLRARFHGGLSATLARHADLARDDEDFMEGEVARAWPSLSRAEPGGGVSLDAAGVCGLHAALRGRVLRRAVEAVAGNRLGLERVHVAAIERLAESGGDPLRLPSGLFAFRDGGLLVFSRSLPAPAPVFSYSVFAPGSHVFPGLRFSCAVVEKTVLDLARRPAAAAPAAWLDADAVRFPLTLRSWIAGDRFRPLGAPGSRKLQDLFTDARIPRNERRRVLVLADAEGILWVAGVRIGERAKMTEATRRVLLCTISREGA